MAVPCSGTTPPFTQPPRPELPLRLGAESGVEASGALTAVEGVTQRVGRRQDSQPHQLRPILVADADRGCRGRFEIEGDLADGVVRAAADTRGGVLVGRRSWRASRLETGKAAPASSAGSDLSLFCPAGAGTSDRGARSCSIAMIRSGTRSRKNTALMTPRSFVFPSHAPYDCSSDVNSNRRACDRLVCHPLIVTVS